MSDNTPADIIKQALDMTINGNNPKPIKDQLLNPYYIRAHPTINPPPAYTLTTHSKIEIKWCQES